LECLMSAVQNSKRAVQFSDLGVASVLVDVLKRAGIKEPFPIQAATIPDAVAGRDVLARAQTGSGKTLAFGLAMLTKLGGRRAEPRMPFGLILVPTRELAMQVSDALQPLSDACGVRGRLIAGGMPYIKQIQALDRGVHYLVATPGRLVDLVNRGSVDLSNVTFTVLDEADQMADMGFMPIVREILDLTSRGSQRLLFSATLDGDVDALIKRYMKDPVRHSLSPAQASVDTMDHHVLLVHPADKNEVVTQIGARDGRTIFFVRTQAGVDRLAEHMTSQGVAAGALHGGKSQAVRTRTLADFKAGITPALVATDVAARGIHVDGISLVVHVDAPNDPKDYLHRAGRTARAGESGTVVTLGSPRQQRHISALTSKAGVKPAVARVRPGDAQLISITGAQEPSGIAWFPPKEKPAKPAFRQGQGRGGPRGPRGPRQHSSDRPGRPGGHRKAAKSGTARSSKQAAR
jgi:superfamily II DNA/RNA helicase